MWFRSRGISCLFLYRRICTAGSEEAAVGVVDEGEAAAEQPCEPPGHSPLTSVLLRLKVVNMGEYF